MINLKNIAKPKETGGWGIKNIFIFGKDLVEKSMCRCIMMPGIWH
jgi:hypothetical protein